MSEAKKSYMVEGVVAFSKLREHDVYNGKSTGRYNLVINPDAEGTLLLEKLGVNVKTYKDKPQRKFSTTFQCEVIDANDEPYTKEIPYGSTVRVLFVTGPEHPVHGVPTYLNKVRVLEEAAHEYEVENGEF